MDPAVINGQLQAEGQVVGRGVVYCRHGGSASAQPLATTAALQILMVCMSVYCLSQKSLIIHL